MVGVMHFVVIILILFSALPLQSHATGENNDDIALMDIAREYRDGGKPGIPRSTSRAARFFEFLIERKDQDPHLLHEAELELSDLLVADPSISSKYSYLILLMRAAAGGNLQAQHLLSVSYATGIAARDVVPMDAGKALFLEYMAALSGHPLANMGLGYRYLHGIGVKESCESALPFYEVAANHAAEAIKARGRAPQPDLFKLSESNDPTGKWMQRDSTLELTDYYAHLAEQGDTMAALTLGNMLLVGSRSMPMNESRAVYFLNLAADSKHPAASGLLGYVLFKQYLRSAQSVVDIAMQTQPARNTPEGTKVVLEKASIQLKTSRFMQLLKFAMQKGDVNGMVGMGLAHFHGVGVPQNLTKSVELLQKVVGAHVDAGFHLGEICMGLKPLESALASAAASVSANAGKSATASTSSSSSSSSSSIATAEANIGSDGEVRVGSSHAGAGASSASAARSATSATSSSTVSNKIGYAVQQKLIDPQGAERAYTVSAQMGNVLAQHRLVHLHKRGFGGGGGGQQGCRQDAQILKQVAERGEWMADLATAHSLYAQGNQMAALYTFAKLAAVGVESAQYNAAYILSRISERGGPVSVTATISDTSTDSDPIRTDFKKLIKELEENEHAAALSLQNDQPGEQHSLASGEAIAKKNINEALPRSTRNIAYISTTKWIDFLTRFNPSSLSTERRPTSLSLSKQQQNRQIEYEARALTLFDLSAAQGNAEAYLQLGDFYYYQRAGLANDVPAVQPTDQQQQQQQQQQQLLSSQRQLQGRSKREAAGFYQKAADLRHTRAIFNLGFMHEVGDGVSQDFHLAKRYYDQAAETDHKAKTPRDVALFMLQCHKALHSWFGPDATTQFLDFQVPLPVLLLHVPFSSPPTAGNTAQRPSPRPLEFRMYTVWEMLREISVLDRNLRLKIDEMVYLVDQRILQPVRSTLNVVVAPLRFLNQLQQLHGIEPLEELPPGAATAAAAVGAEDAAGRGRANNIAVQNPQKDLLGWLLSFPMRVEAAYNAAFENVYRLVHFFARGRHGGREQKVMANEETAAAHSAQRALLNRNLHNHEMVRLREEVLVLFLLCVMFSAVLAFKMLRRRLNEALAAEELGNDNNNNN